MFHLLPCLAMPCLCVLAFVFVLVGPGAVFLALVVGCPPVVVVIALFVVLVVI